MAEFGGGPKVGGNNYLYYNTGTRASQTLVLVDEIGDVSLDGFDRNVASLKRRANSFEKELPAKLTAFSVSVQLIHGLNETVFDVIRAAFLAGTVQEWVILDGLLATVGSQGWAFAGFPKSFPWSQPQEDVGMHDLSLGHGYLVESGTEIDPVWQETTS